MNKSCGPLDGGNDHVPIVSPSKVRVRGDAVALPLEVRVQPRVLLIQENLGGDHEQEGGMKNQSKPGPGFRLPDQSIQRENHQSDHSAKVQPAGYFLREKSDFPLACKNTVAGMNNDSGVKREAAQPKG